MRLSVDRSWGLILGFLSLVGICGLNADEPAKQEVDTKKAEETAAEERIRSFPLPVSNTASGIRVPNFSEAGVMVSQFVIGSATRKTEELVSMERVSMELFDKLGKSEFVIELPASILNLRTGMIVSEDPISIKNPKFELVGEKMEFDTKRKQGRLMGGVKMVILDVNVLGNAK